jgi:hypothetical protein
MSIGLWGARQLCLERRNISKNEALEIVGWK